LSCGRAAATIPAGVRLADLPTGTVTFLFTDVEGSTAHLLALGERYPHALAEHRRVLRRVVEGHDGVEVDVQGDALFAAFGRANDALAAAVEARDALADGPLCVRMGLHTGEPIVTEEGYVGMDVHRGARIAAAGHGGQILVSHSTRELVGGVGLRDLGEHRLKDLTGPERIYQVGTADFPPLRSLNQTALPVQATPLVGRERELREIAESVRRHRLVTLVGAGGSGKTRLGVQAAAELADEFADGVWFVSLASLREPELVGSTIMQTLGADGRQPLEEHLREKELLLVLDNFEHLLAAAVDVGGLLRSAARLHVLVTSRTLLHLSGEHVYPVPPLESEQAVALFNERACALLPSFEPDERVPELCAWLDGLPLAIELAAGRVTLMTPAAMLTRFEKRLPLLTGGAGDAPARQRTLRATVEWSYDLLTKEAQQLLARLAVFAGSWTLAAAQDVCEADFELLADLLDNNLIQQRDDRFSMLETIREFAFEQLDALGEAEQLRRRHAGWYGRRAEQLEHERKAGTTSGSALSELEREIDNFRAALRFLLDKQVNTDALELACNLRGLWRWRGYASEGRSWLADASAAEAQTTKVLRARALHEAGFLARLEGDLAQATMLHERGLELARDEADATAIAANLAGLGIDCTIRGEYEQARNYFHESLRFYEASGDLPGTSRVHHNLANLAGMEGDLALGRTLHEENLRLISMHDDPVLTAVTLSNLGFGCLLQRDLDAAEGFLMRALALLQQLGDKGGVANAMLNLGRLALQRGQHDAAEQHLIESLTTMAEIGRASACAECLHGLAALALAARRPQRAARLLGAAAALSREGPELPLPEQNVLDQLIADIKHALQPGDFDAAWREGEALGFDEMIAYALEEGCVHG
jgi:predicted ATPase/class 3 adenylate cyclase